MYRYLFTLSIFLFLSIHADDVSLIQQFHEILGDKLSKNEKIKQLEYEIQALEYQARAESKWDNPKLSIGINNAEVPTPFDLQANQMQNIFISLGQNLDINQKRKIQVKITNTRSHIKLLELKALKNQYILAIFTQAINAHKNEQILNFTQNAIKNLDVVIASLQSSSNFNPLQIHKLNLLKAKLNIRQNDIINQLQTAHIGISEVSFGYINKFFIPPLTKEALDFVQKPDFIQELIKDNYDIQIALLRENIAKDTLNLAKKSYFGDITINGTYMHRIALPDMFSFSFSLPLPIYGKQMHGLRQSAKENLSAHSNVLQIQNQVKHKAENLLNQIQILRANLDVINGVLLPSNQKLTSLYKHHSTSQNTAFSEFYNALNDEIDSEILRLETSSQIHILYWNLRGLKGEI